MLCCDVFSDDCLSFALEYGWIYSSDDSVHRLIMGLCMGEKCSSLSSIDCRPLHLSSSLTTVSFLSLSLSLCLPSLSSSLLRNNIEWRMQR